MTRRKILLIQFRTNQKVIQQEKRAFLNCLSKNNVEFKTVNIFNDDFFWNNPRKVSNLFSHIILGGSSEFGLGDETDRPEEKKFISKRVSNLINFLINSDRSLLGICFGMHLIAYLQGVKIHRPLEKREFGTIRVFLTQEGTSDYLFKDIGHNSFLANSSHIESLASLPKHFIHLAYTKNCPIVGYRVKNNIYGLQFHPELTKNRFLERIRLTNLKNKKQLSLKVVRTTQIINNFVSL